MSVYNENFERNLPHLSKINDTFLKMLNIIKFIIFFPEFSNSFSGLSCHGSSLVVSYEWDEETLRGLALGYLVIWDFEILLGKAVLGGGCSEEDLLAPEQVFSVFTHLGYRRDAAGMQ